MDVWHAKLLYLVTSNEWAHARFHPTISCDFFPSLSNWVGPRWIFHHLIGLGGGAGCEFYSLNTCTYTNSSFFLQNEHKLNFIRIFFFPRPNGNFSLFWRIKREHNIFNFHFNTYFIKILYTCKSILYMELKAKVEVKYERLVFALVSVVSVLFYSDKENKEIEPLASFIISI